VFARIRSAPLPEPEPRALQPEPEPVARLPEQGEARMGLVELPGLLEQALGFA